MRRSLVIGNWKMNGNLAQLKALLSQLQHAKLRESVEVAVCPPFVYISRALKALVGTPLELGAQNVASEAQGAFTGEISAAMLSDIRCRFVIIGHSERRALYGETEADTLAKVKQCLAHGLVPVLCVGETLAEREAEQTLAVVASQLNAVIGALSDSELTKIVVAYEPVWAIGTGLTASPQQAQEVHAFLRDTLAAKNAKVAAATRILYGGSVKADNAEELFAQPDIDGGLIGGASLDAREFASIVNSAG